MINDLHKAISAVCPIDGISIGRKADRSTWRIDFQQSATAAQKTAAQAILASFDFSVPSRNDALKTEATADVFVDKLRNATGAQIAQYVQTNITDLASAKVLLGKMALALAYLLRNDT